MIAVNGKVRDVTTGPMDKLSGLLTALARPVGAWAPACQLKEWADLLASLENIDWSVVPEAAEEVQGQVSALLARLAEATPVPDDWARAAALTTALTVLKATELGCADLEPWLGGLEDQFEALGGVLSRLYAGPARAGAGPLAFAWIARAALPLALEGEQYLAGPVRAYFEELRRRSQGPEEPPGTTPADPVLAYLRARLAAPAAEPATIPRRRDGTFREWVCGLCNGNPRQWLRSGMLKVAVLVLAVVGLGVGGWLAWAGRTTLSDFRANHIAPYEKAFRGEAADPKGK